MIRYIDDNIPLAGQKVLLRLDLNVPVRDGRVKDDFRMARIIDTVDFLRREGAQVIIISHCEGQESTTLVPMWRYLNGFFPADFSPTYFTPESYDKLTNMEDGSVLLFENLRIHPGEKENDQEFAKQLAKMADMFVNDAFSVSHRKHASIVGVPQFLPHYGGLLLREEISHLSKAFTPEHPFLFVIGGAKFDTKLPIIRKYLERADHVFVGGALADNFFKAQGYNIGTSLVSDGDFGIGELLGNDKLVLPVDVTVRIPEELVAFKRPTDIGNDEAIVDIGPDSLESLKALVAEAKMIVWNGPLGNYENGFTDKTEGLAEMIAESSAESIVGGGDTLAAIGKMGISDSFSFISTGGGAMLDFLVNETLPGIEALEK